MIALMLGTICFANAQMLDLRPTAVTTTAYGNALDTVDNTENHVTTSFSVARWNKGLTANVIVKKISGTVAGSLQLQGSMDNVEWTLIGTATTPTDASNNYSFNTTVAWRYFRISWTGAGTMSASFRNLLLPY